MSPEGSSITVLMSKPYKQYTGEGEVLKASLRPLEDKEKSIFLPFKIYILGDGRSLGPGGNSEGGEGLEGLK